MTTENNITQQILEALKKVKDVKPKVASCSKSYPILNIWSGYLDNYVIDLQFTGYIGYNISQGKGNRFANFPIEVSFSINEIKGDAFMSIDWDYINQEMGYSVFNKKWNPDVMSMLGPQMGMGG
jgi:hypothetical protein